MTEGSRAAFFDMDHPLVLCNTGRVYAANLRERGEIGRRELMRVSAVMLRYKLSLVDMPALMAEAVRALEGKRLDELQARCDALFEERIRPFLAADGVRLVEEHRRQGHRVVVLSAQTELLVRPLCRALGISDFLCTRLEAVDGVLTGRMDGPPCYGASKVFWARRFADEAGVDLAGSWFYTDSFSDLPMLEAVANKRVVNPDPRLWLHARLRRWPVLRFRPRVEAGTVSQEVT